MPHTGLSRQFAAERMREEKVEDGQGKGVCIYHLPCA